jgi:Cof subfamily protein (haloacid dehalogenase superfamily)
MPKKLPNYQEFDIESLRPFYKIRLVAIDLDGTLLATNESEIPTKVLELANCLRSSKYGVVRITFATGRTLAGTRSLLENFPIFKDTPVILYNGSLVLNRKYEILRREVIPQSAVTKIISACSKFNVKLLAYSCDLFCQNGPKEYAIGWSNYDRPSLDYNKMPVKWMDWDNSDISVLPSAIVIHTFGQNNVVRLLTKDLSEIQEIFCSHGGTNYIEVRPRSSNKGIALKFVAEILNISQNEVLAIGDNDNDAEMLSWAGIGVAVDSASEIALQHCKYLASRGVMEGAIQVLKIVRNAKRFLNNSSF